MVGQDVLRHVEPEPGHLGQHGAFLVHFVAQDYVETADAVCRHHDQAVAVVVDFTYLALFDGLTFLNAHVPVSFACSSLFVHVRRRVWPPLTVC